MTYSRTSFVKFLAIPLLVNSYFTATATRCAKTPYSASDGFALEFHLNAFGNSFFKIYLKSWYICFQYLRNIFTHRCFQYFNHFNIHVYSNISTSSHMLIKGIKCFIFIMLSLNHFSVSLDYSAPIFSHVNTPANLPDAASTATTERPLLLEFKWIALKNPSNISFGG